MASIQWLEEIAIKIAKEGLQISEESLHELTKILGLEYAVYKVNCEEVKPFLDETGNSRFNFSDLVTFGLIKIQYVLINNEETREITSDDTLIRSAMGYLDENIPFIILLLLEKFYHGHISLEDAFKRLLVDYQNGKYNDNMNVKQWMGLLQEKYSIYPDLSNLNISAISSPKSMQSGYSTPKSIFPPAVIPQGKDKIKKKKNKKPKQATFSPKVSINIEGKMKKTIQEIGTKSEELMGLADRSIRSTKEQGLLLNEMAANEFLKDLERKYIDLNNQFCAIRKNLEGFKVSENILTGMVFTDQKVKKVDSILKYWKSELNKLSTLKVEQEKKEELKRKEEEEKERKRLIYEREKQKEEKRKNEELGLKRIENEKMIEKFNPTFYNVDDMNFSNYSSEIIRPIQTEDPLSLDKDYNKKQTCSWADSPSEEESLSEEESDLEVMGRDMTNADFYYWCRTLAAEGAWLGDDADTRARIVRYFGGIRVGPINDPISRLRPLPRCQLALEWFRVETGTQAGGLLVDASTQTSDGVIYQHELSPHLRARYARLSEEFENARVQLEPPIPSGVIFARVVPTTEHRAAGIRMALAMHDNPDIATRIDERIRSRLCFNCRAEYLAPGGSCTWVRRGTFCGGCGTRGVTAGTCARCDPGQYTEIVKRERGGSE